MNSWSADRGIWYLVRRLFSNSVVSLGSNSTIVLDVESQRLAVVRSCCRACIRYSRSAWTHRAGKVWFVFTNPSWIGFISKTNYQTKPTSKINPLRDTKTQAESPLPTSPLGSSLLLFTVPTFQVCTDSKQALQEYQEIKHSTDSN